MAATPDGGVILTGGLIDGMDLGAGPMTTAGDQDVFVAKIDGTGALSWVKSFGSPGGDQATSVAVDSQGDILLGGQLAGPIDFGGGPRGQAGAGGMFLVKLDPAGGHVWSRVFTDGELDGPRVAKMVVDAHDEILVAGVFAFGALDLGNGPLAAPADHGAPFLARLRADGTTAWSRAFGAGSVSVTLGDLAVTPSGEAVFSQVTTDDALNTRTDVLVKLDVAGAEVWERPYQTELTDLGGPYTELTAVAVDPTGRILLAGECNPSLDAERWCVISLAEGGAERWRTSLDPLHLQAFAPNLGVDRPGDVYTTYSAAGDSHEGPSPLVRKLGPSGAILWSLDARTPTTNVDTLAVAPSGALFIEGTRASSALPAVDVGAGPMTVGDGFFLAKIMP
jgi:hypothetical protein